MKKEKVKCFGFEPIRYSRGMYNRTIIISYANKKETIIIPASFRSSITKNEIKYSTVVQYIELINSQEKLKTYLLLLIMSQNSY